MAKNIFTQFDEKENVSEQFDSKVKEIEKAEIFEKLKQYNNPVMIKKTGKEIKEHIQNVLLPFITETLQTKKELISSFLKTTPILPTKVPYCKIDLGDEFPYKQYSWDEVHFTEKSVGQVFKGFGDIECDSCEDVCECPNCCSSQEEADSRASYNILVEEVRDLLLDLKTANVLLNNLEDNQEYWLNLDQVVALKF